MQVRLPTALLTALGLLRGLTVYPWVAAIVKLLLAAGADRNIAVNGMRPVDLARRQSKSEVVALLVGEGQSSWGSGQPRSMPEGTTGKQVRALERLHGGPVPDTWSNIQFKHRERLMQLKDG